MFESFVGFGREFPNSLHIMQRCIYLLVDLKLIQAWGVANLEFWIRLYLVY